MYIILFISWLMMYHIGLAASLMLSFTYLQITSARFPYWKAFAISVAWFIVLPIVSCYIAWKRKDQIQAMAEQFKMLQQIQAQMSAVNQLMSGANIETKGNEGTRIDQSYEQ